MEETALNEPALRRIIYTAPSRYKTFYIPKRNGKNRRIEQPARELKAIQRVLVQKLLSTLPVHPSATAYRPGLSVRDNAARHAHNGPVLKFDFEDFFPSIRARDWRVYCEKKGLLETEEDIYLTQQIFFRREKGSSVLRLAIGAPSSPALSNILMWDIDAAIAEMIDGEQVSYTRYADDLTFSARRTGYLNGIEKGLRAILRSAGGPRLKINEEKTVLATKKFRRQVTGLILANDGHVSLGRDKKRLIRAAVHRETLGLLETSEREQLAGMLAYVNVAEPLFLARLKKKYGVEAIEELKKAVRPGNEPERP
nr:retron St85 family RNA-directed DNA polymerase [Phenylobacterium glaciei]